MCGYQNDRNQTKEEGKRLTVRQGEETELGATTDTEGEGERRAVARIDEKAGRKQGSKEGRHHAEQ